MQKAHIILSESDRKEPGAMLRQNGLRSKVFRRVTITALACSEAPDGHARWSLRLLADKIVELNYCETISHEQVSRLLKKTK